VLVLIEFGLTRLTKRAVVPTPARRLLIARAVEFGLAMRIERRPPIRAAHGASSIGWTHGRGNLAALGFARADSIFALVHDERESGEKT
jgi:hypothetical protein